MPRARAATFLVRSRARRKDTVRGSTIGAHVDLCHGESAVQGLPRPSGVLGSHGLAQRGQAAAVTCLLGVVDGDTLDTSKVSDISVCIILDPMSRSSSPSSKRRRGALSARRPFLLPVSMSAWILPREGRVCASEHVVVGGVILRLDGRGEAHQARSLGG